MDVKVICLCGTKFAFDIEPLNGRMPCAIKCPACGADATAAANEVIAQKLAAAPPPPVPKSSAVPVRVMHVGAPAPAAVSAAPTVAVAAAAPVEASAIPYCPKHQTEIAVAECFVCQKPICSHCMQQFGYLCSSYCKGQADARKLKVPVYAGQIHQKMNAERKSQNFLVMAAVSAVAAMLVGYVWYWFVGSRPKQAFKVETGPGTPFLHSEWLGDDRFFAVTPAYVTMYNAADGAEVWRFEIPAGEIKTSKAGENEWSASFDPGVKVVSKDIWVGLPSRVVRLEGQTGKKKQEIPLPARTGGYQVSDTFFLAAAGNETNDSKTLIRINLTNGGIETQNTPISTGARRIAGVTRLMPGLNNTSISKMDPTDEEFSDYSTTTFGLDRDYLFTGQNVAHITRNVLETRIAVQASTKPRTGPSIIDNPNARASQGIAAAEEFINSNQADTKIDQSLYSVTIRRYFGGAPEWTGQVAGRPFIFAQKTVDYLAAGNTLIVFNKNNQKLWEAKLTYSISPGYWHSEETAGPAFELGNRLLFWDQGVLTAFDIKKGEAQWRVNSVGISGVAPDSEGNLYISSTTAGPENIKYDKQISLTDKIYPMIVKVELKTGKVLWQSARVGTDIQVSNGIIYTTSEQVSGMEMIAASSRGESAPVNWRLYRIDPSNGHDMFEYHRLGVPLAVRPKQKRIILQYPDAIRMMKYM